MKQVLFMAMLVAGMLLTGCSKDSESKGMETKGNAEQQLADMKQHVVGTWVKYGEAYVEDQASIKAHVFNGITNGVDVLFDVDITPTSEYNPNTLTINADGTLVVSDDGESLITGTYVINAITDLGFNIFLPTYTIRKDVEHFDIDFMRSQLYDFRYLFFEKGYNIMYFFLADGSTLCRYRRR